MEIHSPDSTILYLQLEINCPQNKCLSVIILDTTVIRGRLKVGNLGTKQIGPNPLLFGIAFCIVLLYQSPSVPLHT